MFLKQIFVRESKLGGANMLLLRDTLMSLLFATGFSSACQFKIDIEIFFNESREKSLNPNVKFEKRQQTNKTQSIHFNIVYFL